MSGHEPAAVETLAHALDHDGGAPPDLAELRRLARALHDVPVATPRPEFRRALRATLIREAATQVPVIRRPEPFGERLGRWRRSAALAVASAMSALTIGGAGLAAAAQHAAPDQALYGVKLFTESVRVALADGHIEAGQLRLTFAERRLDEISDGARTLDPDTLVATLAAMDDASRAGATALLDVYDGSGDTAVLQAVVGFTERQRTRLTDVLGELPVEVVPFARGSLEVVRGIEVQTSALVLSGCLPCTDGPVTMFGDGPPVPAAGCCTPMTTGAGAVSDAGDAATKAVDARSSRNAADPTTSDQTPDMSVSVSDPSLPAHDPALPSDDDTPLTDQPPAVPIEPPSVPVATPAPPLGGPEPPSIDHLLFD
ncbi:MAG: DUF5667 domain-containing protein [Actinomycetota bacterium]|nr:DUF5667 domain-containing protein [Actinomycetota bacterium]